MSSAAGMTWTRITGPLARTPNASAAPSAAAAAGRGAFDSDQAAMSPASVAAASIVSNIVADP